MSSPTFRAILSTPTFRLACLFSVGTLLLISAISAFIYWQTAVAIIQRADDLLVRDLHIMAEDTTANAATFIERRLNNRLHIIVVAGLFAPDGTQLAGNLQRIPASAKLDGKVYKVAKYETCCMQLDPNTGRLLAGTLPSGNVVVLGRNVDGVESLRQTISQALLTGILPAIVLALGVGTILGRRTAWWMGSVQSAAQRIEAGEIWKRLPVPDTNDSTRWLVESMNRILDGIGEVVDTSRSSSAHLAHDLLAPLSSIRARLERASTATNDIDDMRDTVVQAIASLDQAVRLASALLRISTIERGHIRNQFKPVALDHILTEVAELFSVIAEDKGIHLEIVIHHTAMLMGDRDLLMEAVANLVDNAIKYTPAGGKVQVYLDKRDGQPVMGVCDNGPGLPADQRQRVLDRFYRYAEGTNIPGHGLGLSLVNAVVRLHGLTLHLDDAHPGLIIEITTPPPAR